MSLLREIIIAGKNFLGGKEEVGVNDLSLNVGDFYLLVAEGKIPGKKAIHKFGKNPDVSRNSGFQTIWNGGGDYTGFNATAAETVTVTSDDPGDTLLGVGLRTIRLYGLDANFLEQTEDIDMNGALGTTSIKEFIRMDRAKGLSSGGGTFGTNLGDVTVAQSVTTANIFAVLPATYGTTMIAAYTIPAGKKGYLLSRVASLSNKKAASVDIRFKIKSPGNVFTVRGETALNSNGTGYVNRQFKIPPYLPPMTDIFMEGDSDTDIAVAGFFDILLVDD